MYSKSFMMKEGKSKIRPQSGKNNKSFKNVESDEKDEQKIFEDFVGMISRYDQSSFFIIFYFFYSLLHI